MQSGAQPATQTEVRGETHWPPLAAVLAAVLLQFLLPDRVVAGPRWLVPAVEVVLLVYALVVSPEKFTGPHALRRRVMLGLVGLASAANGVSLVLLCKSLLQSRVEQGHELIVAGALIWLTNILIFGLWYWSLDRGGPGRRAAGTGDEPDFLFPQNQEDVAKMCPGWRPVFADYLYLGLTNATAFSPTDAMPLSITAKMLMGLQSLVSLVTIGLVIARAVNVL